MRKVWLIVFLAISVVVFLLFFCACGISGDNTSYTESEYSETESDTPKSESDPGETGNDSDGSVVPVDIDYSVEGWLAASEEEEKEKALTALLKARSDLVKEKDLGTWYDLQTTTITVTGYDLSFEITDIDVIAQIGTLLSPEKLRACVAIPEITQEFKDPGSDYFNETALYGSFSGGDYLLLDFHNGLYIGVLFDAGETKREVTEVRIGKSGQLDERSVEIPSTINPEIPFLYKAGSYNTDRAIDKLLAGLIGN